MSNKIVLPRMMQVGAGASQEVANIMRSLNVSNALIITDKMMVKLGYIDKIKDAITKDGLAAEVFDNTVPEPTASSIAEGLSVVRQGDFDCIVAVGGGSPIDSAKVISVVGKFGGEVSEYKFPRDVSEAGLPVIAVPTTAGTGSEVTRFTIITDDKTDEKMLLGGLGFMPVAALVDYELTLSLPKRVTADCGLDALTHAIEAFVSKKANTYSDYQAITAMKMISANITKVYTNPDDEKAREAMMLGSTLAGIAFSNSSVALVHGMSRPIGAAFHVPHGLSNAMLLPEITKWSVRSDLERYALCAREMQLATIKDSNARACNRLVDFLEHLNRSLHVPTLKEFGIDKQKFFDLIPTMAEQALASGSPSNNPKVPTIGELQELYKAVWRD